MLIHDPDRTAGHLTRVSYLGWPTPRALRRAAKSVLFRRGWTAGNSQASAGVLSLALLVSSLPASDLNAAGALLATETA